jgi:ABC-type spermidine/putrescine transport system permease subunit II
VQEFGHLVGGPVWTSAMNTAFSDALTTIAKNGGDLFVGPFLLGLLVFVYLPIGWSTVLSFFDARNTVVPCSGWAGWGTEEAMRSKYDAELLRPPGIRLTSARIGGIGLRTVALVIATILFLIPFYLLLRNGLSTEDEITAPSWTFFPHSLQWSNFGELFSDPEVSLARSLVNSVVVSTVRTLGQLLLCGLAGYGLARIPYRHANKIFSAVVGSLMIPAAVTFLPTFVVSPRSVGSTTCAV